MKANQEGTPDGSQESVDLTLESNRHIPMMTAGQQTP